MSFSHFPQYEHELFWRYYDKLQAFLAHCDLYLEKWKILNTVYEGVNCEIRALLEYWDFRAKNIDKAWDFLDWLAQDSYEYEISCTNSYIPPPCIPDYAPPVCEICHCSNHESNSCPRDISDDSFAKLSSLIETINE